MDGVIITGNVQTVSAAGLTLPAVTITSSVTPGVTLQGEVTTGGIGPPGTPGTTDHLELTNIGTNTHAQIDTTLTNLAAADALRVLKAGDTMTGKLSITRANGANDEGLRVTQNDTTNNPRAVTIVNTANSYALKIDDNGTGDHDSVNIVGAGTGAQTVVGINGVNTSLSTVKLVNSANQLTGSVMAALGTGTGRTSDIISATNAGTGQSFKANTDGNGISFDAQSLATSKQAFNADVANTSSQALRIKNTGAHTADELALFWQSNSSSTAPVLKTTNLGTGNSLEVHDAGGLKARITSGGNLIANLVSGTNGFINQSSSSNSRLQLATTGATVDRNIADANPTLIVRQVHASSTGDILQLKNDTSTVVTINRLGAAAFSADVTVPDEAYGAAWDGSLEVPTKNALYDKIQTLGGGGSGDVVGPVSSTDNAIVRYDGTTGKLLQNSGPVVSDDNVMTFPANGRIILTHDTDTDAFATPNIGKLLEFRMTNQYDRPWANWYDENGRLRVSLGYHSTDYASGGAHNRFEIKGSTDPAGATPDSMLTRFFISTNQDRTDFSMGYLQRLYLDKTLYVADQQWGIAFRSPRATGTTVTTASILNQLTSGDDTILTIDPITPDATKQATLRLFRNTNTTAAKRIVVFKGDNTATETFSLNVDTGTITAGVWAGTDIAVADGGTGASDAATARTNLGLGSLAVQAATNVAITGGSITGITDIAVADGGTGASSASSARTNLGAQASTFKTVGSADADYITTGSGDEGPIQNAINAVATAGGGVVFIKAGVYFLDAGLVFPMDAKVRLLGVKWAKVTGVYGGTCLLAAAAMTDLINISGNASVTTNADLSHDNHFENIIFSGGSGNATNVFKLKNTDLVKFESCYIVAGVNGIVTEYVGVDPLTDASIPGGLIINNCIIANTTRNLDMQYQGQCWINNVWFDSSSGSAVTSHIRLKSCVKVHINNCEINMAVAGIEFEDTATAPCHEITIGGCSFTVGVGNKLWSVSTQNNANSKHINIYGGTRDSSGTYDQLWNEEQPKAFIGLDRDRFYARGNLTGAQTFNREDGHTHGATLTGNVTATVTNGRTKGDTLTLVLTQDATGSRTVTWPSTVKSAPVLSTTPGSIDTLVLVWDGTNWNTYNLSNPTIQAAVRSSARAVPFGSSDFLNASQPAPFHASAIASGTGVTALAGAVTANHPGIYRARSSTTANSGVQLGANVNHILLGGAEEFEVIFQLPLTAGNTVRIGFHDSATNADAVDGCYVEIPDTGVITGKTANNSVRSTTTTTYASVANTWYRLKIVLDATAARVDFYLYNDAGTQLWTENLTTNIPTASGRETGAGIVGTNSGTVAVDVFSVDYMSVYFGRTLVR